MFMLSFRSRDARVSNREATSATMGSRTRVGKTARMTKKSSGSRRDPQKLPRVQRPLNSDETSRMRSQPQAGSSSMFFSPTPIVTLTVGREGRLFAAHEGVLCQASFFEKILHGNYLEARSKRIVLAEEEPEIFSVILEYLYKGDYYPRLLHNKDSDSWELEDSVPATPRRSPQSGGYSISSAASSPRFPGKLMSVEATVYLPRIGEHVLRDTAIYCAADRYGLEELKRLSLRKQGLQTGIDVGTILHSAKYCYAHTPDSDSRLRAHYLALIIRSRRTFKRSGTMQAEMEKCGTNSVYATGGGKLFFDLFVAMCNHLDDVIDASNARTPRVI